MESLHLENEKIGGEIIQRWILSIYVARIGDE
jgi:hypothetical protein